MNNESGSMINAKGYNCFLNAENEQDIMCNLGDCSGHHRRAVCPCSLKRAVELLASYDIIPALSLSLSAVVV